jgi:hypothetical protein
MTAAVTLSNVWYGTQLATIFFSFATFATSYSSSYILAYISIVASLTISLYQSLTASASSSASSSSASSSATNPSGSTSTKKAPPANIPVQAQAVDFVKSLTPLVGPAKSHPTTPYILLAVSYLFVLPRSIITLAPFVIFAFFHVVNYTKTFVLPRMNASPSLKERAISILDIIATQYSDVGFTWAVQFQLLSLCISFLWAVINTPLNLIGHGDGHSLLNYLTVLVWVAFISIVQSQNLLMRSAITRVVTILDGVMADPRVPLGIKDAWVRVKHIVKNKNLNHSQ